MVSTYIKEIKRKDRAELTFILAAGRTANGGILRRVERVGYLRFARVLLDGILSQCDRYVAVLRHG